MSRVDAESSEALAALTACGQALAEGGGLRRTLTSALRVLVAQSADGLSGGAIHLIGDTPSKTTLHVAEGSWAGHRRATGALSNAVRQVVDTGRAAIEPRVIGTARDGDAVQTFSRVIVPITLSRRVIGVIGLHYLLDPQRDLDHAVQALGVLAAMVAQAVAMHRRREPSAGDTGEMRPPGARERRFSRLVGTSEPLGQVHTQVANVAPSSTTVLIRGESGTGKGLIAQAIHHHSPRAGKAFVTVGCAALPPDLIESELFGYEKGAFTGAVAAKKGRLEVANGGTLFLDEVGELSPAVQVKLLRVLQAREFDRLGGTQTLKLDVRIIAATNRNLEKAVAAGDFREDLYYRLNVFPIFVPPLRERKADILLLADHFLEKFAKEHGKPLRRIATPAIDMLASYHWPGNVRELENAIERAVVVCDGGVLHAHHLPPTLQTAETTGTVSNLSLQEMVEAVEKDALQDALKTTRGNRATAARLLRTTRRIFNYKVRTYGIDWRRFLD